MRTVYISLILLPVLLSCQSSTVWTKETGPANRIVIVQNDPQAVKDRCSFAPNAAACANVGGDADGVCTIHFNKEWYIDWKLLEHELLHCAGYNHPK